MGTGLADLLYTRPMPAATSWNQPLVFQGTHSLGTSAFRTSAIIEWIFGLSIFWDFGV